MSNNQKFLSMREITGNVYTMSNTLYDRYMSQIPQKNNKHITHTHVCKVGLFIFDYDKTDLVILGTHFMYIHTCLRLLRKKHSAKHTCLWNIHTTYHNDMGPLLILTAQTVFEGSRRFDRYLYSKRLCLPDLRQIKRFLPFHTFVSMPIKHFKCSILQ